MHEHDSDAPRGEDAIDLAEAYLDMAQLRVGLERLIDSIESVVASGTYTMKCEMFDLAQQLVTEGDRGAALLRTEPRPRMLPGAPSWAPEHLENLVQSLAAAADLLRPMLLELANAIGVEVDPSHRPDD